MACIGIIRRHGSFETFLSNMRPDCPWNKVTTLLSEASHDIIYASLASNNQVGTLHLLGFSPTTLSAFADDGGLTRADIGFLIDVLWRSRKSMLPLRLKGLLPGLPVFLFLIYHLTQFTDMLEFERPWLNVQDLVQRCYLGNSNTYERNILRQVSRWIHDRVSGGHDFIVKLDYVPVDDDDACTVVKAYSDLLKPPIPLSLAPVMLLDVSMTMFRWISYMLRNPQPSRRALEKLAPIAAKAALERLWLEFDRERDGPMANNRRGFTRVYALDVLNNISAHYFATPDLQIREDMLRMLLGMEIYSLLGRVLALVTYESGVYIGPTHQLSNNVTYDLILPNSTLVLGLLGFMADGVAATSSWVLRLIHSYRTTLDASPFGPGQNAPSQWHHAPDPHMTFPRGIKPRFTAQSFSTVPPNFSFRIRGKYRMTAPEFDDALLEKLFPAPTFSSAFTSPSAPTPNAGITPESTAVLRRLLIENHKRFHIFFNDKGFHNHLSHHLFAAYGIGAPGHVLQAAFDEHAEYQRSAYKSPEPITQDNWTKHLGNEDFYNAYMGFFAHEIQTHGLRQTFERFVFSHEANWAKDEPRMLDRFISGLLHPLIHFGHAAEFGVEGMAVEGLAQAAVHKTAYTKLYDASYFSSSSSTGSYLASLTSALTLGGGAKPQHTHALTILARILVDERLEAGKTCAKESDSKFTDTVNNVGDIIREYASLWKVSEDEKEIQERVEELAWLVALMFGVGGWKKDRDFKADFFLVHLVTSDLFIPSILSLLKPAHKVDLLRAYFPVLLAYFVSRGRPALDVKGFFSSVTVDPKPEHSSVSESSEAVGNPWYTVLTHTIPHRDEHHVKAERALAHSAALYGIRPKGCFSHTELKGAEEIDGTLFVRTGGLLMHTLNWNFELKKTLDTNEEEWKWSRDGLGWD
ncbi:transmembrane protein, putative [Rhizoctonia solani AG-3 Rhs1AP]|uniref:Transmembrane protein, putative n=1 Tax=Rhizoctonia solani AG-3 Rhs1AP TaxID=1086054 RepID=X8IWW0_9AGAM|nr:transmembrane protein, putative [Rhizoctonia solani AG-3 Rhs1AP]